MVVLYSEPSPEHQERHRRRRPAAVRYGPAPADDVGGLPECAGLATEGDLERNETSRRRRAECARRVRPPNSSAARS